MPNFDPEGLDLPPPEEQTAARERRRWLGRIVMGLRPSRSARVETALDMQHTLGWTEALFEAELAGLDLQRLVDSTVPEQDGYHLDWLANKHGLIISERRMEVVVPIWRAHNAESLASLLDFLSYIHSHEDSVTANDLREFVENARLAETTLTGSLAED